ncbi:hypothetical protein RHMOL_Rhmol12G0050200 [Rhododendron molle]|uniref:Uncharacterized protein n=1 Tax=Rhododendron molle TaxID=49168 RepID=A0ACC0LFQ0_RHOML|nr:hypothetical protein RHMOL_Rhmol12G0050200 [Rhododendron molle]
MFCSVIEKGGCNRLCECVNVQGKIRVEEGWISLGPWGGNDGVDWTYKANGPIMQISICYGQAIDSILFESKSCDGVLVGRSKKIGGTGGHVTEMFCIDTSEEQLSSISLTYEHFSGKVTIISLCICTNLHKYGPFGSRTGASSLSIPIPIDGGVLIGFHGRVRTHLTAIGILVAPKVNSLHPIQDPDSAPTQFKVSFYPLHADLQVFGSGVGSKLKTLENNIHNTASSSGTTNKDDHHGGAPSPSSEMIRKDLDLVDSAFQKYIMYMDKQISEAREKLKELQKLGSSERDFDELGLVIAKLKFQIPLISNKDDHHSGALSPTSKMIRSDLILVDTAFAEAKESLYHMNVKINQAHDKFKDLQLLPSTERDSDKLRKADSDKLRKDIAKLKVRIRSYHKIRSVNSNLHHKNWDNINGAKDGMTHFFHREPEVTQTGDFDGILKAFHYLPEPLQDCLLCFFKFPPMATIKRTPMIYLWVGQGYISRLLKNNGYVWDVEVYAGKIFDELIAKGFIEPLYQNCSLTPDSCKMSLYVRSSLYDEAKRRGFTSNGTLDLDLGFVCGGLDGHSCLINVGEAIISCEPKLFENLKHIRSLYLGRWQILATHHIELADTKILHGLNKLNSLTFLSLRGISIITELPTFISELNNLMILDLRACHNLEVIPDEIGLLKSLTHLDMSECYFLEYMPKSLAHLSNLQVFKGFLIGDFDNNKQSCTLLDLSGLRKLRKLNIYFSVTDLLRLQDLKNLERFEGLKKLTISWGGCSLQDRVEDTAIAFANATLPPRLQKLDLQCFPTTSLPDNWMMPSKHLELKKLYIKGGHLCDLREIQERQGEQWTVEILQLKYLSKLNIDWRKLRILFPMLIYLHQVECPKVTNFPCDEKGVWMDDKAINTHVQLLKYLKTSGMISSSSNWGSSSTSARDDSNICPVDEK